MEQIKTMSIPNRSIVYFSICLAGILIILFGGVLPYRKALAQMDGKISSLRSQIEEQKALVPIYESLKKKVYRREMVALPSPAGEKLPRERIEKISSTLRDMGRTSDIEVLSVSPDMNFMADDNKALLVNTTAR